MICALTALYLVQGQEPETKKRETMEFTKDPLKSRENAQRLLAQAASQLRETATDLDLFQQRDQVRMGEHGAAYAEALSNKTNLLQKVQSSMLDLARAQRLLAEAVAEAASA